VEKREKVFTQWPIKVAQLIEQLSHDSKLAGSNPATNSSGRRLRKR